MKKTKKEETPPSKIIEPVVDNSIGGPILLKPFKYIWKILDELYIFEKWVRIRYHFVLYGILGLLASYIIFYQLLSSAVIYVNTLSTNKSTRENVIKVEKQKAKKYDLIEKENKFLREIRERQLFDVYQHDLFMWLYDYYKNHGTLQKWYWINTWVFDQVYTASDKSRNLCPSFAEAYFRMFPAEREYFRHKIKEQYKDQDISAKKFEELEKIEEDKYIKLIFPLHDFAKCKRESNFNQKCKSYNYKMEKSGTFQGWFIFKDNSGRHARRDSNDRSVFYVVDKMGIYDKDIDGKNWKKYLEEDLGWERFLITDSIDWGIEQMNTVCLEGGNREVAKVRPYLANRDIFDIEKNICMRTIHTEDLIKRHKEWFLVDQDFFWLLRNLMWKRYYPDMSEFVGY